MSNAVQVAMIILALIKEINLAYFRLLETAEMTDEERAKLREEFMAANLEAIPKPEDLE